VKRAIYDKLLHLTGHNKEYCYRAIPNFKCSKCLTSYHEVKSLNIKKVNGIAAVYDSLSKKESVKAGYYIARVFVTRFLKAAQAFFINVLESSDVTAIKCQDMLSSLESPTQSIICRHENLATKVTEKRLQVISAETWEMIRYLLPDALGIESTNESCQTCRDMDMETKKKLLSWGDQTLKDEACSHVFERLDNHSNGASSDPSHCTGRIYLVNTAIISECRDFAKRPCTYVGRVVVNASLNPLLCCHQKLRLPMKLAHDVRLKNEIEQWRYEDNFNCNSTYECITEKEWLSLKARIEEANSIVGRCHIDLESNKYAIITFPTLVMEPELCGICADDDIISLNFRILTNEEKLPAPYSKEASRKSVLCKIRSTLKVSRSLKLAGLRIQMKEKCRFDLWNQELILQGYTQVTFTDKDNGKSLKALQITNDDILFVRYRKTSGIGKRHLSTLEADLEARLREIDAGENNVRRGISYTNQVSVQSASVTVGSGTIKSGHVKLQIVNVAQPEERNELEVASKILLGDLKLLIFHHFNHSYQISTQQLFLDSCFKSELRDDQNLKSLSDIGICNGSTIYVLYDTGTTSSMSVIFGKDGSVLEVAL